MLGQLLPGPAAPPGPARTARLLVLDIVAAIVLSVITLSPRFLLAKEGLLTAIWGLWFLVSTRSRRPAAFVMARPLMEGRKTFSAGSWDDLWHSDPAFRHIWRVATVMWGSACWSTRCCAW